MEPGSALDPEITVNNEKFATALSLPKQIFRHGIMDEGGRIEERTK